ncbi:hypothetical protein ACGFSI_03560 [Streptomyces virginiae]|uniref:hypothetical protein n=1 Tax=Streptomyces virginiae TaxID=1961 RepID=UPI00371E4944
MPTRSTGAATWEVALLQLLDAAFWTSSDLARSFDAPDFLARDLEGGRPFTDHMMDLGLIAVSADEVGVFWSFHAN